MASPGLLNLQTDLKSLRYGSDKPYITKDINNPPSSNQTGMQITKRVDDLSRISQMLIDRPGLKFIGNQALLQQVDIQGKLEKARDKKQTLGGKLFEQAKGTVLNTAKIIGSTLTQVPVNGTGTHFVYGFRTDTYLQPSGGNNRSGFAQFFGAGGVEGAPLALKGELIEGEVISNFGTKVSNTEFKIDVESQLDYDEKVNLPIPEGSEGHKALAEAGKPITIPGPQWETTAQPTELGRSNQLKEEDKKDLKPYDPVPFKNTFTSTDTYIEEQKKRVTKKGNVLKENRILLGDQGAQSTPEKQNARRKNQYWFMSDTTNPTGSLEVDQMNAISVRDLKVDGNKEGRDIIKFRFHIVTPGEEKILYFRAFLDTFSDTYTGQWNPTKYIGRAEDFQVYGGFQRKISLSFKIAAATRVEMKPLYQKMLYLASSTAPTYADSGQFMRGTIVKMTVGDYVYELPGVMNSVNYSWNVEYPWEIAMLEPEGGQGDQEMQELPMIMDCQLDFTPIHTFTPETGLKKYFTAGTNGTNSFI